MDYGVSSEVLEWGAKYLPKYEMGDENSIKYMRMSSTPSPQVINHPSLRSVANSWCKLVFSRIMYLPTLNKY